MFEILAIIYLTHVFHNLTLCIHIQKELRN